MALRRSYKIPKRFNKPTDLKSLLRASARASSLGMAVLDSQTRFQAVNAALARETQAPADFHIGRTSREIVGDLARQIEQTYESVLSGGPSSSVPLVGRVRDNQDTGYWLDHCFPIRSGSGRVQQLGLFVVNVTVQKASMEIFHSLALTSLDMHGQTARAVRELEETIEAYHCQLSLSLDELVSNYAEPARKAETFLTSVQDLDTSIRNMRELVYAVTSRLSIPFC